jgi:hypothetical protein
MSSDKAAPIEGAGGSLDRDVSATQTVDQWEDLSARAARLLMNDYGVPDRVASDRLTWNNRGPWRRIVVRDEPPSDAAGKDLGLIEETVPYGALSPSQTADLARFDDRIAFDAAAGELSASSDDESLNILSLNLADDVVERRLNPEQARAAYFHDMELEQSGKTPRDMLSLRLTR